jgi:hypothetical protein
MEAGMTDETRKGDGRRWPRRGEAARSWPGFVLLALVAVVTGAFAIGGASSRASGPVATAAAATGGKTAICTFTNPSYAGECIEGTPIPEGSTAMKACLAILDCLNNPHCTKTYCDATTIRVGWRLKSADEE